MYQHPETRLQMSKERQHDLRREVAEERLARQAQESADAGMTSTTARRPWWRRSWRTAFLRAEPVRHKP